MDSHCKYQNEVSESAIVREQQALKVNGKWDSDWFIAHYAQNTLIAFL